MKESRGLNLRQESPLFNNRSPTKNLTTPTASEGANVSDTLHWDFNANGTFNS